MGMYDIIDNIPLTYDNQVKLWGCQLDTLGFGSKVPAIGAIATYSVALKPTERDVGGPLYVIVENGVLSGISGDPLVGHPVFDKWGGYVTTGTAPAPPNASIPFDPATQDFAIELAHGMLFITVRDKQ